MAKQRRSFTKDLKKQIINLYLSKKKTLEQIEKEYNVTRYQIFQWREKTEDLSVSHISPKLIPSPILSTPSSPSAKDAMIFELQAEVGRMHLKIRKLEAALGLGKSYDDDDHKSNLPQKRSL